MSALGQKQTRAAHKLMSALPPIATAKSGHPMVDQRGQRMQGAMGRFAAA
jgi:hypothetical protein